MKLSARTIQILKNFATINPSLIFKYGSEIATITPTKTVMAKATVVETFPRQFAIYDLSRFLSVISLFEDSEFEFHDRFVRIKKDRQHVDYVYADPSLIVAPPDKTINMPDAEIKFVLSNQDLTKITKAMAVLQVPEIAIVGENNEISICAIDTKNITGDKFEVTVGQTNHTFQMIFLAENIRLIPGDYEVSISTKGLGHFKSQDIQYWIACEASSSFEK